MDLTVSNVILIIYADRLDGDVVCARYASRLRGNYAGGLNFCVALWVWTQHK